MPKIVNCRYDKCCKKLSDQPFEGKFCDIECADAVIGISSYKWKKP